MPTITRNVAFPYEKDEFDILLGTLDEDDRDADDSTTREFDRADGRDDVLHFNFQGGDGNDEFFGGPNGDIIKGGKGLDSLYGEDGNDYIYGGADTDWLFGDGGEDQLFGEDGSDQLYGGAGHDVLDGGELSDWLHGGTHDDILEGGTDADNLIGGSGSDNFLFVVGNWYNPDSPSFNPDTIWDFNANDGDRIVLQGSDLLPGAAGYVEGTIDYGAGYDAALSHAMSLLDGDKTYAFVTDGVDGYLFMEPWSGAFPAIETVGIKLLGLTDVSDFQWWNVGTAIY